METADTGIAVVGCGAWGLNHLRVWNELGCLMAACDSSRARLDAVRERYPSTDLVMNLDEILRRGDVRAVVVSTPAITHVELAVRVLEAGKDVLIEKPLALTVGEAEKIRDLAENLGSILAVGHVLEYHPAVLKLRELIASGGLGEIRYLYSHRLNLGRVRTEENALWSFAPHDIALMLRMLEGFPSEVSCRGGAYINREVADVTLMSLAFPSRIMAHVFVSWLHPYKVHRFVVVGSEQMADFDDAAPWDSKLRLFPHKVELTGNDPPVARRAEAIRVPVDPIEPLRAECEHFLDCIRTRVRPLTDAESGIRVLRVLEAGHRSLMDAGAPKYL